MYHPLNIDINNRGVFGGLWPVLEAAHNAQGSAHGCSLSLSIIHLLCSLINVEHGAIEHVGDLNYILWTCELSASYLLLSHRILDMITLRTCIIRL